MQIKTPSYVFFANLIEPNCTSWPPQHLHLIDIIHHSSHSRPLSLLISTSWPKVRLCLLSKRTQWWSRPWLKTKLPARIACIIRGWSDKSAQWKCRPMPFQRSLTPRDIRNLKHFSVMQIVICSVTVTAAYFFIFDVWTSVFTRGKLPVTVCFQIWCPQPWARLFGCTRVQEQICLGLSVRVCPMCD